ncbi:hypothetical protein SAMN04488587_1429 [Methanococcoides vulcani]|uniref:Uncharacterized protein n=1 Tax=Methanococcoides vulcani TaxID=1353158 RepID=A0A1I0A0Z4_9EURY|nr:hypothetical protein SAMN04488587_1429 [Methanococcoides vulcani]
MSWGMDHLTAVKGDLIKRDVHKSKKTDIQKPWIVSHQHSIFMWLFISSLIFCVSIIVGNTFIHYNMFDMARYMIYPISLLAGIVIFLVLLAGYSVYKELKHCF